MSVLTDWPASLLWYCGCCNTFSRFSFYSGTNMPTSTTLTIRRAVLLLNEQQIRITRGSQTSPWFPQSGRARKGGHEEQKKGFSVYVEAFEKPPTLLWRNRVCSLEICFIRRKTVPKRMIEVPAAAMFFIASCRAPEPAKILQCSKEGRTSATVQSAIIWGTNCYNWWPFVDDMPAARGRFGATAFQ